MTSLINVLQTQSKNIVFSQFVLNKFKESCTIRINAKVFESFLHDFLEKNEIFFNKTIETANLFIKEVNENPPEKTGLLSLLSQPKEEDKEDENFLVSDRGKSWYIE